MLALRKLVAARHLATLFEGQNQHRLLAQRLGNILKEGKSEHRHAAQTLEGGVIAFVHGKPLRLAEFPSA